ncbi:MULTISPECIES: NAD(P)-dependent oxidoreductase [Paenibacillus]|uniref:NAD-binding protein n=1 Tax=Paenibacillus validus TaxID=44253 RepID=A0A7X2Z6V0_9BACL|nr:NAD(P)-dependent oxidoreductase [Paenibacillus validus]MUG69394.1 NAD-binding protein [Paenibacillus validus]
MEIAFIGLGAMGLPMAKRLIKAEHGLHIIKHRNPLPVEELASMGATVHEHAADAVLACDMIISILPSDKEMESVLLEESVLESAKPGALLLEMTSGSPQMMKKVAKAYMDKGIRVLDAPVSGGTTGAEQGTLTLMIGGKQEDVEEAKPVMEAMGKNFFLVGSYGAGKAVKAINQLLAAVHMLASSEALAIAESLEVDLNMLNEVVGKSSGGSWIFANKLKAVADGQFDPGFRLNLMKKDVGIAIKEGEGISLPLSTLAYQLYEMAALTDGDQDFAAVSKLIRK